MRVFLIFGAMFVLPTVLAVEQTCQACLDNCCDWAFSTPSQSLPFGHFWVEAGPCAEDEQLVASRELNNCATKAFDRCVEQYCPKCALTSFIKTALFLDRALLGHRGISGSKPIQFHQGQIIEVGPRFNVTGKQLSSRIRPVEPRALRRRNRPSTPVIDVD